MVKYIVLVALYNHIGYPIIQHVTGNIIHVYKLDLEPFGCKCYELCHTTCPRTRLSSGTLSEPSRLIISVYVEVLYDPIQKLLQNITETTVDSLIVGEQLNFHGKSSCHWHVLNYFHLRTKFYLFYGTIFYRIDIQYFIQNLL